MRWTFTSPPCPSPSPLFLSISPSQSTYPEMKAIYLKAAAQTSMLVDVVGPALGARLDDLSQCKAKAKNFSIVCTFPIHYTTMHFKQIAAKPLSQFYLIPSSPSLILYLPLFPPFIVWQMSNSITDTTSKCEQAISIKMLSLSII